MPSTPRTRKRQQQARRAKQPPAVKAKIRSKDTKARKQARRELEDDERRRIRAENTAAMKLSREKQSREGQRKMEMALHEAKERRRRRKANLEWSKAVQEYEDEYLRLAPEYDKAIERWCDVLNGGPFSDEEKARRDTAAAADAQARSEAALAAIAEKSRKEEARAA